MSNDIMSIVTQVNIYRSGDSPIYGDSVISVGVSDDGAGIYLSIQQTTEDGNNILKIEFDELDELIKVCNSFKDNFRNIE